MSDDLYEPCPMCRDKPSLVHGGPDCPGCRGRRFVPVGLTSRQFELYARKAEERDALVRAFVNRAINGRWHVGLPCLTASGWPTTVGDAFDDRKDAVKALIDGAKSRCQPAELDALAREERECDELRAEVERLKARLVARGIRPPAADECAHGRKLGEPCPRCRDEERKAIFRGSKQED